eukprot:TRINITY_DN12205_c0_g4_i1.p1 TRINITY_DN12205_c0_g4~~TRINITY_DN12205_c0_g4_i1.p1  ORF type:complete len:129 (-),score=1.30 TRINITY_DN12205_c0_g4_i1:142-528(-)
MGNSIICYEGYTYITLSRILYVIRDILPCIMTFKMTSLLKLAAYRYPCKNFIAGTTVFLYFVDTVVYTAWFMLDATDNLMRADFCMRLREWRYGLCLIMCAGTLLGTIRVMCIVQRLSPNSPTGTYSS